MIFKIKCRLWHLNCTSIVLVLSSLSFDNIQHKQGSFIIMPRLNSDSRNQVNGMFRTGISQCEVATSFNVYVSTISRFNMRFIVTDSTKDRPRTGQPFVTTRCQDNFIGLRHLWDRLKTAVKAASVLVSRHGRYIHGSILDTD